MPNTNALKRYRVLYNVQLAEWYEITAASSEEAERTAYTDGKQIYGHTQRSPQREVIDVTSCEAKRFKTYHPVDRLQRQNQLRRHCR